MKIKFEWEDVHSPQSSDYTERAKVMGGWLVRTFFSRPNEFKNLYNQSCSMIFIYDPVHEWELDNGSYDF